MEGRMTTKRLREPFRVPWGRDDDAADGDGLQLRLRARSPVVIFDVERLDVKMGAERRA
jgi:hypothetical protein